MAKVKEYDVLSFGEWEEDKYQRELKAYNEDNVDTVAADAGQP
jgi:hypothetical protein